MEATRFDFSLWKKRLTDLGYPLSESKIPTQFLRDRRAIPPGVNLKEAKLVYNDPLGIDIIVLEFDRMPSRIWAETHDLYPSFLGSCCIKAAPVVFSSRLCMDQVRGNNPYRTFWWN